MNRQLTREDLLKMYQQEASDNRDRKQAEKQQKVIEERQALDRLNREIEQEKRMIQNTKMQRMHEQMEEYKEMQLKKQMERENNGRRFTKGESQGTFKIGGENREIKRRNYDDISNVNNTLALTRDDRGTQQRGKSQGIGIGRGVNNNFNIINHTTSNFENYSGQNNHLRVNNVNNINYGLGSGSALAKNNYDMNNNINLGGPNNKEVEGIENLENFPYAIEVNKQNENVDIQPQKGANEEAEFQKYYEEYLKQKMKEENDNDGKENIQSYSNIHINNSEIPTTLKEYEAYREKNMNNNYSVNELNAQMNNLNIQNEKSNEYLSNKMRNRNGHGYNNITHQPDSYYSNAKPVVDYESNNVMSKKLEQQEMYRNYLNSQIQERNNIQSNNCSDNNRIKLSKKEFNPSNPYTTKNYDFGGSSLSTNPITNPVNSYQFNASKYQQPNMNREIGSARMRAIGNSIMK